MISARICLNEDQITSNIVIKAESQSTNLFKISYVAIVNVNQRNYKLYTTNFI